MLQKGKSCWLSKTQQIYNGVGVSYKFNMAGTEFMVQHVNEVMTQLSDQFVQNWFVQLNQLDGRAGSMSNKLRTYKLFKDVFQLEYYLTGVTLAKHRIALTKLRVSCHHLAIETGRYHKPSPLPVEQRLCAVCNVVEDEVHLMCLCAHNAHLRRELFARVSHVYPHFSSLNPTNKLVFIMQIKEHYLTNRVATFVYYSLLLAK